MRTVVARTASLLMILTVARPGFAQRSPLEQAFPPKNTHDATNAVADALVDAGKTNRYVLLNFGANWCPECRVLDQTFADPSVSSFLKANFVVVAVPVGQMVGTNYAEENIGLVKKYGVFTTNENAGIPSIVILDSSGKVVARTDAGEWRKGEAVLPENVIRDLKRWAPKR